MTIKLEVGKKYRNRNGEVVEIVKELIRHGFYKFQNPLYISYSIDGRLLKEVETPLDLIEEVNELVKKLHKHAELIKAWADGAQIEWQSNSGRWLSTTQPEWDLNRCYRIKPPEVPQWRKDLAEKMKVGGVLQFNWGGDNPWKESLLSIDRVLDDEGNMTEGRYRIKPETKPDVVETWSVSKDNFYKDSTSSANLKLIWYGETGNLKGAEVLK